MRRFLFLSQNGVAVAMAAFLALCLAQDGIGTAAPTASAAPARPVTETPLTLTGRSLVVTLLPSSGRLSLATTDGQSGRELELSLVIDGAEVALVGDVASVTHVGETGLRVPLTVAGLPRGAVTLALSVDEPSNGLVVSLIRDGSPSKHVSLRFGTAPATGAVFIPERGELADTGDVVARSIVLDDGARPLGVVPNTGELTAALVAPEFAQTPATQPRLILTAAGASAVGGVRLVVPESSQELWGAIYGAMQVPLARVSGTVTGTSERARVVALDEQGHPLLRLWTGDGGRFSVDAPPDAVRWYAKLEASHASPPVRHAFGTATEVRLLIAPGGELRVRVIDPDTRQPLVSRLLVRGVEGTVDPSFHGDFRGRGAGRVIDLREGESAIPLPAGKYRVEAVKGLEWSIDSEVVQIWNGRTTSTELQPRHVVPTPGLVGCDLHVHARPSFDSSVTPEDRVVSLASAGIDFAVPTEHNRVGDYAPALETEHLAGKLASVPGVEVTTYQPRIGHFGVFPYPKNAAVPPYRGATLASVFAAARKGDSSRVLVVHHPRLPLALGYFDALGFDSKTGRIPAPMRTDFDVLEVYSGFEMTDRSKVERVLDDWFGLLEMGKRYVASGSSDSHKLQYQWAGYPRTYVRLAADQAGDEGAPIDAAAVVRAVKTGRGFVTSGPIVELDVDGSRPGDELVLRGNKVGVNLRVRAAPWIDVSSIQVIAGRTVLFETEVAARDTVIGKESGTLDEAAARTVRFEGPIEVTVPPRATWLVVVVRGSRSYEDALPFMPVQPLAFSNPVWLVRRP